MPIDYSKYPPDWIERRERILKRAEQRCEECGVRNYSQGYRLPDGKFIVLDGNAIEEAKAQGVKVITIVLTIAHLDHDETNWDVPDYRLAALCQRCHLRYDISEKRKRKHNKKAIADLFQS